MDSSNVTPKFNECIFTYVSVGEREFFLQFKLMWHFPHQLQQWCNQTQRSLGLVYPNLLRVGALAESSSEYDYSKKSTPLIIPPHKYKVPATKILLESFPRGP